jgi:hypothetical protein
MWFRAEEDGRSRKARQVAGIGGGGAGSVRGVAEQRMDGKKLAHGAPGLRRREFMTENK